MFFASKKALAKVRRILGWTSGGIHKRIDHNREILQTLQKKAPHLIANDPWIVSKLQGNDEFFCALAEHVPPDQVQFSATPPDHPGRPFPRPWPEVEMALGGEPPVDLNAEVSTLRAALVRLMASDAGIAGATDEDLQSAIGDAEADPVIREQAASVLQARQALSPPIQQADAPGRT